MDQPLINNFADLTGDHEWIHVDVEAARRGPYGSTIAHGLLTLSLVPLLASSVYNFELPDQLVFYGLDSVRFPAAVPSGKRIRSAITPKAVLPHERGHRIVMRHTVEVEHQDRPGCVADTVFFALSASAS